MQLKPWIVAVNFGDGPTAQLYVNAIVAPTSELAVAHVVAMTLQQIKTDQPLTRIMWQEVEAEFLTAALSLMRGEAGGEKVVSLRVVEELKPAPPDPIAEKLAADTLSSGGKYVQDRASADGQFNGPFPVPSWQTCVSCPTPDFCRSQICCHSPPASAS